MPSRILIIPLLFCLTQLSFANWTKIGLDGKTITAIACGKPWTTRMVFAGTKSDGVFYGRDPFGSFSLLSSMGMDSLAPALKAVHCLYYGGGSTILPFLFAGTDSGLFRYVFTSGVPAQWARIGGVPAEPVSAITANGDSGFCATRTEVYKGHIAGNIWAACSTQKFLPSLPSFSSLAVWGGINAGSQGTSSKESYNGVLNSGNFGNTWKDISVVSGVRLSYVLSLSTYRPNWVSPLKLIAGTNSGIFWIDDFDTGTWTAIEPQLKVAPAKNLYITYHTRSTIADIFASTDSGVCVLSDQVKPGEWMVSLKGTASGVASFDSMDTKEWFAAMGDGVYRFTLDPASVFSDVSNAFKAPQQIQSGMFFTLDGRKICRPSGSGVYLFRNGQTGLSRVFINQQGKNSHLK